jgi:hypothetical protein
VTEQHQDDPHPEEHHREEAQKLPLLIWTGLSPGDVVSLRGLGARDWIGTIESRTSDGLVIRIREHLNQRKSFHFRECQSVHVIRSPGLQQQ